MRPGSEQNEEEILPSTNQGQNYRKRRARNDER